MCQYAYKFKLVLDFIFLLCLFVLFCFFDTAYGIIQALLTVAVFFCLINGNGFFGLLNTKAARILGEMSFSVYLLHGLIITAVNSLLPSHSFHVQNYWIITLSTGFTVILLSSLTYQLIECRFYKNHLGVAQN
ncbi:hypothetical protein DFR44_1211 [Hydromonas duriensis]|uniref:Acyltransferase 3 domain-containing protein n=2 Tax=Hydromonas duriensis TaxID=1527608 RepID=A0A4R6Y535_9BURK|nr:hypothetical protein DFR44_1211 [Hydromonas duriensis]